MIFVALFLFFLFYQRYLLLYSSLTCVISVAMEVRQNYVLKNQGGIVGVYAHYSNASTSDSCFG